VTGTNCRSDPFGNIFIIHLLRNQFKMKLYKQHCSRTTQKTLVSKITMASSK